PSKIRCLAYGDSITQGLNATLPSQTWLGQVALALDADIHNLGVGGACLDEGLSSIPVPGDFNLITIKYGTNDFCWHLVPQLRENAAKLVEWNRRAFPNAKILLITPMPDFVPGDEEKLDSLGNCREDYRTGLLECAKEIGVPCVYGPDLLNSPDLMSDGVHPSDAGMKQISDRLVPIIQELLAVKG
ncbi:MAG: hypothetical protein HRT89_20705, partial [Lentisphaeria bacterium]|nr:hypothetical protein [Lentisphaeria bacterium]